MIRLFAALAVPPQAARALSHAQCGLPGARWRPAEALHVTLRFFGDLREDVARDLDEALAEVSGEALEISLAGVGAFGEGADIHAVWAAVQATPALTQLAARCESAARHVGLKAETRKYLPHVTLAYLRRPEPTDVAAWLEAHGLLRAEPFTIERFGLYSSWRTSEGSRYRLEQTYPLSDPDAEFDAHLTP